MVGEDYVPTNVSGRDMWRLVPITAAFAAVAAVICWWGFAGLTSSTDTFRSLFANIWPIVALLGLSAAWGVAFLRICGHAEPLFREVARIDAHYRNLMFALALITILLLAAGVFALRAFANSGDEYSYLFQAATLRAGGLWNIPPPLSDVFVFNHIVIMDGKWVSQYPPGWPIIIAGVIGLGLPAYVASPAMALLLLLTFFRLVRELVSPSAALAGGALLASSPFFLFNGSSYFSHVPATMFSVLFVLGGLCFTINSSIPAALAAGTALGIVLIIRPLSAVLIAIPCAIELLLRAGSLHYRRFAWFLVGFLPFIAALLFYNAAITGDPFLDPMSWDHPKFHFGLRPVDEFGLQPTFRRSLLWVIVRLNELAQWTSPLLCFLYASAALWKLRHARLAFYDFIFPMFVLGYLLYPGLGGNRYGPRYYFEAYPFMLLTVVSAASAWLAVPRSGPRQGLVGGALVGAVVMALAAYPALAYQLRRIVNERMELYDLVARSQLSNAVVVIRSPTGSQRGSSCEWGRCDGMGSSVMGRMDLTRNGIDLSQSVLYVLDRPTEYCALSRTFPGRALYRYERDDDTRVGVLRPLADHC